MGELFASARESVLVAGYAVYQGQRVFQALADRMVEVPGLKVRMFLDIQRGHGDTTAASGLIRRFAARFRSDQWPKDRPLPRLLDPRSLETDPSDGPACMRNVSSSMARTSSCRRRISRRRPKRNIEIGLLIDSSELATRLTSYFQGLLTMISSHPCDCNSLVPDPLWSLSARRPHLLEHFCLSSRIGKGMVLYCLCGLILHSYAARPRFSQAHRSTPCNTT